MPPHHAHLLHHHWLHHLGFHHHFHARHLHHGPFGKFRSKLKLFGDILLLTLSLWLRLQLLWLHLVTEWEQRTPPWEWYSWKNTRPTRFTKRPPTETGRRRCSWWWWFSGSKHRCMASQSIVIAIITRRTAFVYPCSIIVLISKVGKERWKENTYS